LAGIVVSLSVAPSAPAALDEVNTAQLRRAVTVNGMLAHARAFQTIANRNGGTRASGTPGYDASVAYVRNRLVIAGYEVREQEFDYEFYQELAPPRLAVTAPTPKTYATLTLEYSGSGDVTAPLQEVDNQFPPGATANSSTAGCEAADFAGFTPGNVALIQRGTCPFAQKVANARAAGASAVIIFNEGQPGRTEQINGTLGAPESIPAVALPFADGEDLHNQLQAGPVTVNVFASVQIEQRTTKNVIADSTGGDEEQTIVIGAHLDSVPEGPGINDNGSGSAGILEIAEEIAELAGPGGENTRRHLRFAFWGAEESGLVGSEFYVNSLPPGEVGQIYANLNFDMIGSPNYVRFVYDGDGDLTPDVDTDGGPPGSGEIERMFNQYFADQGLASEPTAFDGRSDYEAFTLAGIPAGGLFTGAEVVKTAEQAAIYGGTAGIAFDPCYHQACDTIRNVSTRALNEMGDAAAHGTWTLARSRSGLFEDGSRRASRARAKAFTFKGALAQR
jgi:Zn-dependent M28 family amino/carboxypeptidase